MNQPCSRTFTNSSSCPAVAAVHFFFTILELLTFFVDNKTIWAKAMCYDDFLTFKQVL
jgi:hypothetical protein